MCGIMGSLLLMQWWYNGSFTGYWYRDNWNTRRETIPKFKIIKSEKKPKLNIN